MAYARQVDLLEPVDLAEHLDKLELYLGQVCQIAGISKMQLDYWTNKAQIPTKGKKQRIYDIDALETVMLIKQAKDKGLNLGAAIEAARRFRETSRAARASSVLARAARPPPPRARSGVDVDRRRRARAPARTRQARQRPRGASGRRRGARGCSGTGALDRAQPAERLGERARARRRAARSRSASARGSARRDQQLVGRAAGVRAEQRRGRRARRPRVAVGSSTASSSQSRQSPSALGGERRRRLGEPDELRVGVRQARAGRAALVDERVHVREAAPRARPRARRQASATSSSSLVVELGERARRARGAWTTTSCRSNAG